MWVAEHLERPYVKIGVRPPRDVVVVGVGWFRDERVDLWVTERTALLGFSPAHAQAGGVSGHDIRVVDLRGVR